jgi:hypothetical protein
MRITLHTILLFLLVESCGSRNIKTTTSCNDKPYTTIDSALKCGADPLQYKSLLFAFVTSNIEQNQAKGWDILNDEDIINMAKRDYVLIIIDPRKIDIPKEYQTKEFLEILKQERKEPYFVVTNRVFYPFREFTLHTEKDRIIDDLAIGEGP